MKLMRIGDRGRERPVVRIDDESYVEVWDVVGDFDGDYFESGHLDRLQRAVSIRVSRGLTHRFSGERVGCPVARPMQAVRFSPRPTADPDVAIKSSHAVTGGDDEPSLSASATGGAALGVVLSRRASRLESDDEARARIIGFTLVGDFADESESPLWSSTTPTGPWLVTADEFAGVEDLGMWLEVNGVRRGVTTLGAELLDPYSAVRRLSQHMVLEAGDLITLSPSSAGAVLACEPGDEVRVGIDVLGAQWRRVVALSRQLVWV